MEILLIVILVLMIGGAIFSLEAKDLLSAVIAYGIVGFGLVICFLLLQAPDLALVQIVVETITLIIMIAVILNSTREDVKTRGGIRSVFFVIFAFIFAGLFLYFFNRVTGTLSDFGEHVMRMSEAYVLPGAANRVWVIWLILAVFGSALTLASFIKFISGIYLGRLKSELKKTGEVSILMWLPEIIIAIICLGFGIFATKYVIPNLIVPLSGEFIYEGAWASNTVTALIIVSIVIGFIIYLLGRVKNFRTTEGFIGGETIVEETDFSSVEFYKTVSAFKIFSFFYKKAEKRCFDIYDNSKNIILNLNAMLSKAHAGILPLYALWVVLGLIIIVIVLLF